MSFPKFLKLYPDDNAVLAEVFGQVYGHLETCPGCDGKARFNRIRARKCYCCQHCGYQLHPLAHTPMRATKLPLVSWFYAMLLFANSKNGVSAKELQRQLGVTYKTAFRICRVLRTAMAEKGAVLSGTVEIDETMATGRKRGGKRGWGSDKPIIFGMAQRGGGVITRVVPNRKAETIMPIIVEHTTEDVTAYTDEYRGYNKLGREVAKHDTVHHANYEWARGEVHTNTMEGHWGNLKPSIIGTYRSVSPKYLQTYLDEFSFRYNHRNGDIFAALRAKMYVRSNVA